MFEYHGWLTIQGSPFETDDETEVMHEAFDLLERELEDMEGLPGCRDLRWVNGQAQFHFSGFRNHLTPAERSMFDLAARVGKKAPGSYGLIYFQDDEDPDAKRRNEFQVVAIRRGELHMERDGFLSPVIPRLEDGE